MGHTKDWWEKIRLWLLPKLSPILESAEYNTDNNQFVGIVNIPEEEFEKELDSMGFMRNPLAALKTLSSTNEKEEGSWRKVYPDSDPDMQLHVVLFDGSPKHNANTGKTHIYAHYEPRWDRRPFDHYNATDYQPEVGVRKMRSLLDKNNISYKTSSKRTKHRRINRNT